MVEVVSLPVEDRADEVVSLLVGDPAAAVAMADFLLVGDPEAAVAMANSLLVADRTNILPLGVVDLPEILVTARRSKISMSRPVPNNG